MHMAGFKFGCGAKKIHWLKETKCNVEYRHKYLARVRALRGAAYETRGKGWLPKTPVVCLDESYVNLNHTRKTF